jgi:hypothetical protein
MGRLKSVYPIWFSVKNYACECALFSGYIGPNGYDLPIDDQYTYFLPTLVYLSRRSRALIPYRINSLLLPPNPILSPHLLIRPLLAHLLSDWLCNYAISIRSRNILQILLLGLTAFKWKHSHPAVSNHILIVGSSWLGLTIRITLDYCWASILQCYPSLLTWTKGNNLHQSLTGWLNTVRKVWFDQARCQVEEDTCKYRYT